MEKRTILFVDDEESVLNSLQRGLIDEPYGTLFADSGKEALELLSKNEVQVIVSDMRMPGMDGLEFIRKVKKEYPFTIRLIMSGYTDSNTLLNAVNQGKIFRYIPKPWNTDEVKLILHQAIEYYNNHRDRELLMRALERLIEGAGPEEVNLEFIHETINSRKRFQDEWTEKFSETSADLQGV